MYHSGDEKQRTVEGDLGPRPVGLRGGADTACTGAQHTLMGGEKRGLGRGDWGLHQYWRMGAERCVRCCRWGRSHPQKVWRDMVGQQCSRRAQPPLMHTRRPEGKQRERTHTDTHRHTHMHTHTHTLLVSMLMVCVQLYILSIYPTPEADLTKHQSTSSSASAHLILVDMLYAPVEVQSPSLVCIPHCDN